MMSQKGFTLLEVIVAVYIIASLSVAPILGLVSISFGISQINNSKLTAANLAQGGIELVRNLRDANSNWNAWYTAISSGDYLVAYDRNQLLPYENKPLKIDADGFYNYSSGDNTSFYHKVSINKISSDEVKVVSTVVWSERGRGHSVVVEDRLWNWR